MSRTINWPEFTLPPINLYSMPRQIAMENTVDTTLNERGTRYGDFKGHAAITQSIKRVMQNAPRWNDLSDDKKEALEMVAHKIGRILNGDPEYHDSWHDIIGYTRLVEKDLSK